MNSKNPIPAETNKHSALPMLFIGLGAQKAATSWLAKMLNEHPRIEVSPHKETHYFSSNLYRDDLYGYEKFFSGCNPALLWGEFSPLYLTSDSAPERIRKHFPGIKLIVILRDPVDRARSHIEHLRSKKKVVEKMSIKEILTKHKEVLLHGLYGEGLERYYNLFSKEQILVIWYEDVINKPKKVVESTFKFLDMESISDIKGIYTPHNTSGARRSPFFRIVHRLYFYLQKNALGRILIQFMRLLGIRGQQVDTLLTHLSKKTGVKFTKEEVEFIRNFYKQDREKLCSILEICSLPWDDKYQVNS